MWRLCGSVGLLHLEQYTVLADLRTALPRDSYICTDVGWNKNGLAQQYPVYEPGTDRKSVV